MPIELQATTEPGVRLVALAETLAEDFATRAGQHDKEGSYPFESIEALKAAGYFGAPIPEELGGLGVTSVHDVVVASSRLARGDASVAIGVNMHLTVLMAIVRRWQVARESGNERRAAAFGGFLEWVAEDGVVLAAAVSERSQDLTRPVHDRRAHRVGLDDRREQGLLHDVAGGHRPLHGRLLHRRRRAGSATGTRTCLPPPRG